VLRDALDGCLARWRARATAGERRGEGGQHPARSEAHRDPSRCAPDDRDLRRPGVTGRCGLGAVFGKPQRPVRDHRPQRACEGAISAAG